VDVIAEVGTSKLKTCLKGLLVRSKDTSTRVKSTQTQCAAQIAKNTLEEPKSLEALAVGGERVEIIFCTADVGG